jgi:hypothetical protein
MTGLLDARGCLTPAGIARVRQSPPGRAPEELARHLAECASCQARLLGADIEGARPAGRRPAPDDGRGRMWRLAAFTIAVLALALMAVFLISALPR